MAARAALGIAEGGLFPGVTFYITMWYRRHECGFRMAIFFSAATAAGAFGGLLARGITEMDGLGGLDGWAWIFILEGLLTVVCAVASFWILEDFPDTAKFLTETERTSQTTHNKVPSFNTQPSEGVWVVRRLQSDMKFSAGGESFKLKYVWQSLSDWKTWVASRLPPRS